MWPNVNTFQLKATKLLHKNDEYRLFRKYSKYLVTGERNITDAAKLLLATSAIRHGEVVVQVEKLLEIVENSKYQPGLSSLINALESTLKYHKTLTVRELQGFVQRKVVVDGFKILLGINAAMDELNNMGKKHQAYISPKSFLSTLMFAFK